MKYVLSPVGNSPYMYYLDDLAYCDKRTAQHKKDIQNRWEARKLKRHLQNNLQPSQNSHIRKM